MSASSWAAQPRPSPLPQLNRRVIDTTHASPVCYRSNAEARLFDRVDEWMSKLIQASAPEIQLSPNVSVTGRLSSLQTKIQLARKVLGSSILCRLFISRAKRRVQHKFSLWNRNIGLRRHKVQMDSIAHQCLALNQQLYAKILSIPMYHAFYRGQYERQRRAFDALKEKSLALHRNEAFNQKIQVVQKLYKWRKLVEAWLRWKTSRGQDETRYLKRAFLLSWRTYVNQTHHTFNTAQQGQLQLRIFLLQWKQTIDKRLKQQSQLRRLMHRMINRSIRAAMHQWKLNMDRLFYQSCTIHRLVLRMAYAKLSTMYIHWHRIVFTEKRQISTHQTRWQLKNLNCTVSLWRSQTIKAKQHRLASSVIFHGSIRMMRCLQRRGFHRWNRFTSHQNKKRSTLVRFLSRRGRQLKWDGFLLWNRAIHRRKSHEKRLRQMLLRCSSISLRDPFRKWTRVTRRFHENQHEKAVVLYRRMVDRSRLAQIFKYWQNRTRHCHFMRLLLSRAQGHQTQAQRYRVFVFWRRKVQEKRRSIRILQRVMLRWTQREKTNAFRCWNSRIIEEKFQHGQQLASELRSQLETSKFCRNLVIEKLHFTSVRSLLSRSFHQWTRLLVLEKNNSLEETSDRIKLSTFFFKWFRFQLTRRRCRNIFLRLIQMQATCNKYAAFYTWKLLDQTKTFIQRHNEELYQLKQTQRQQRLSQSLRIIASSNANLQTTAFGNWKLWSRLQQQKHLLSNEMLNGHIYRLTARVFQAWKQFIRRRLIGGRIMERWISRRSRTALHWSFNQWRIQLKFHRMHGQTRQVYFHYLFVSKIQYLTASFSSWKTLVSQRKRSIATLIRIRRDQDRYLLISVLHSWKVATMQLDVMGYLLSRMTNRMLTYQLRGAFRLWRHESQSLKLSRQEEAHRAIQKASDTAHRITMHQYALRLSRIGKVLVFSQWKQFIGRSRQLESSCKKMRLAKRTSQLKSRWQTWRQIFVQRNALRRVLGRCFKRELYHAVATWKKYTELHRFQSVLQSNRARNLKQFLCRKSATSRQKRLNMCFHCWRGYATQSREARGQRMKIATLTEARRLLRNVFRHWRDFYQCLQRRNYILVQILVRLERRNMMIALEKLSIELSMRQHLQEMSQRHCNRIDKLLQLHLSTKKTGIYTRCFLMWVNFTSKRLRLRQLWRGLDRKARDRKISLAFASWKSEFTIRARCLKLLMRWDHQVYRDQLKLGFNRLQKNFRESHREYLAKDFASASIASKEAQKQRSLIYFQEIGRLSVGFYFSLWASYWKFSRNRTTRVVNMLRRLKNSHTKHAFKRWATLSACHSTRDRLVEKYCRRMTHENISKAFSIWHRHARSMTHVSASLTSAKNTRDCIRSVLHKMHAINEVNVRNRAFDGWKWHTGNRAERLRLKESYSSQKWMLQRKTVAFMNWKAFHVKRRVQIANLMQYLQRMRVFTLQRAFYDFTTIYHGQKALIKNEEHHQQLCHHRKRSTQQVLRALQLQTMNQTRIVFFRWRQFLSCRQTKRSRSVKVIALCVKYVQTKRFRSWKRFYCENRDRRRKLRRLLSQICFKTLSQAFRHLVFVSLSIKHAEMTLKAHEMYRDSILSSVMKNIGQSNHQILRNTWTQWISNQSSCRDVYQRIVLMWKTKSIRQAMRSWTVWCLHRQKQRLLLDRMFQVKLTVAFRTWKQRDREASSHRQSQDKIQIALMFASTKTQGNTTLFLLRVFLRWSKFSTLRKNTKADFIERFMLRSRGTVQSHAFKSWFKYMNTIKSTRDVLQRCLDTLYRDGKRRGFRIWYCFSHETHLRQIYAQEESKRSVLMSRQRFNTGKVIDQLHCSRQLYLMHQIFRQWSIQSSRDRQFSLVQHMIERNRRLGTLKKHLDGWRRRIESQIVEKRLEQAHSAVIIHVERMMSKVQGVTVGAAFTAWKKDAQSSILLRNHVACHAFRKLMQDGISRLFIRWRHYCRIRELQRVICVRMNTRWKIRQERRAWFKWKTVLVLNRFTKQSKIDTEQVNRQIVLTRELYQKRIRVSIARFSQNTMHNSFRRWKMHSKICRERRINVLTRLGGKSTRILLSQSLSALRWNCQRNHHHRLVFKHAFGNWLKLQCRHSFTKWALMTRQGIYQDSLTRCKQHLEYIQGIHVSKSLARYNLNNIRLCFREWKRWTSEASEHKEMMKTFLSRRSCLSTVKVFYLWRGYIESRRALRRCCVKCWKNKRFRAMLTAWNKWSSFRSQLQREEYRLSVKHRSLKMIDLRRIDGLAKVFIEWRRCAHITRQKCITIAERWLTSSMGHLFSTWKLYIADSIRARTLCHRLLARLAHRVLSKALSKWKTENKINSVYEEQAAIIQKLQSSKARHLLWIISSRSPSPRALQQIVIDGWLQLVADARHRKRLIHRIISRLDRKYVHRAFLRWKKMDLTAIFSQRLTIMLSRQNQSSEWNNLSIFFRNWVLVMTRSKWQLQCAMQMQSSKQYKDLLMIWKGWKGSSSNQINRKVKCLRIWKRRSTRDVASAWRLWREHTHQACRLHLASVLLQRKAKVPLICVSFSEWRSWARRQIRIRRISDRTRLRRCQRTIAKVFYVWRDHLNLLRRTLDRLTSRAKQNQSIRLQSFFYHWIRQIATERAAQIQYKMIQQIIGVQKYSAFYRWSRYVASRAQERQNEQKRADDSSLRNYLRHWREKMRVEKLKRSRVKKVLVRCMHRSLYKAMRYWTQYTIALTHFNQLRHRTLKRMITGRTKCLITSAFSLWQYGYKNDLQKQQRILHVMTDQYRSRAFRTWSLQVQMLKDQRQLMKRMLRRMQYRLCSQSLRCWRDRIDEMQLKIQILANMFTTWSQYRRFRTETLRRVAQKWLHRSKERSLQSWKSFHAEKRHSRSLIAIVFKRWNERQLLAAFSDWKTQIQKQIEYFKTELLISRFGSRWNGGRIKLAFSLWLSFHFHNRRVLKSILSSWSRRRVHSAWKVLLQHADQVKESESIQILKFQLFQKSLQRRLQVKIFYNWKKQKTFGADQRHIICRLVYKAWNRQLCRYSLWKWSETAFNEALQEKIIRKLVQRTRNSTLMKHLSVWRLNAGRSRDLELRQLREALRKAQDRAIARTKEIIQSDQRTLIRFSFVKWTEMTLKNARHREILSRIAFKTSKAQTKRIFHAWMLFATESMDQRRAIYRILNRLCRSKTFNAFRNWERIVRNERELAFLERLNSKVSFQIQKNVQRMIQSRSHLVLGTVFNPWRQHTAVQSRRKQKLVKVRNIWLCRNVSKSFRGWIAYINMRYLERRVLKRLENRFYVDYIRFGLSRWRSATVSQQLVAESKQTETVNRIIYKWGRSRSMNLVRCWFFAFRREKAVVNVRIDYFIDRKLQRAVRSCLLNWKSHLTYRDTFRRILCRLSARLLGSGWRTWKAWHFAERMRLQTKVEGNTLLHQVVSRREDKAIVLESFSHWKYFVRFNKQKGRAALYFATVGNRKNLSLYFLRWHSSINATLKQRRNLERRLDRVSRMIWNRKRKQAFDNLRFHLYRAQLDVLEHQYALNAAQSFLKTVVMGSQRRAWNTWKEYLAHRRHLKQIVSFYIGKWRLRILSRGIETWKYRNRKLQVLEKLLHRKTRRQNLNEVQRSWKKWTRMCSDIVVALESVMVTQRSTKRLMFALWRSHYTVQKQHIRMMIAFRSWETWLSSQKLSRKGLYNTLRRMQNVLLAKGFRCLSENVLSFRHGEALAKIKQNSDQSLQDQAISFESRSSDALNKVSIYLLNITTSKRCRESLNHWRQFIYECRMIRSSLGRLGDKFTTKIVRRSFDNWKRGSYMIGLTMVRQLMVQTEGEYKKRFLKRMIMALKTRYMTEAFLFWDAKRLKYNALRRFISRMSQGYSLSATTTGFRYWKAQMKHHQYIGSIVQRCWITTTDREKRSRFISWRVFIHKKQRSRRILNTLSRIVQCSTRRFWFHQWNRVSKAKNAHESLLRVFFRQIFRHQLKFSFRRWIKACQQMQLDECYETIRQSEEITAAWSHSRVKKLVASRMISTQRQLFTEWKIQCQRSKIYASFTNVIANRFDSRLISKSFAAWKTFSTLQKKLIWKLVFTYRNRVQSEALRTWKKSIDARKLIDMHTCYCKTLMRRLLHRCFNRSLNAAFQHWHDGTTADREKECLVKQRQRKLIKTLMCFEKRHLRVSFVQWITAHRAELKVRYRSQALVKTSTHWRLRQIRSSFRVWYHAFRFESFTNTEKERKLLYCRIIYTKLYRQRLSNSFRKWIQVDKWMDERQLKTKRIALRIRSRAVALAWARWKQVAGEIRKRSKSQGSQILCSILRRCQNKSTNSAFNKWKNDLMFENARESIRQHEHILSMLMTQKHRQITMIFYAWKGITKARRLSMTRVASIVQRWRARLLSAAVKTLQFWAERHKQQNALLSRMVFHLFNRRQHQAFRTWLDCISTNKLQKERERSKMVFMTLTTMSNSILLERVFKIWKERLAKMKRMSKLLKYLLLRQELRLQSLWLKKWASISQLWSKQLRVIEKLVSQSATAQLRSKFTHWAKINAQLQQRDIISRRIRLWLYSRSRMCLYQSWLKLKAAATSSSVVKLSFVRIFSRWRFRQQNASFSCWKEKYDLWKFKRQKARAILLKMGHFHLRLYLSYWQGFIRQHQQSTTRDLVLRKLQYIMVKNDKYFLIDVLKAWKSFKDNQRTIRRLVIRCCLKLRNAAMIDAIKKWIRVVEIQLKREFHLRQHLRRLLHQQLWWAHVKWIRVTVDKRSRVNATTNTAQRLEILQQKSILAAWRAWIQFKKKNLQRISRFLSTQRVTLLQCAYDRWKCENGKIMAVRRIVEKFQRKQMAVQFYYWFRHSNKLGMLEVASVYESVLRKERRKVNHALNCYLRKAQDAKAFRILLAWKRYVLEMSEKKRIACRVFNRCMSKWFLGQQGRAFLKWDRTVQQSRILGQILRRLTTKHCHQALMLWRNGIYRKTCVFDSKVNVQKLRRRYFNQLHEYHTKSMVLLILNEWRRLVKSLKKYRRSKARMVRRWKYHRVARVFRAWRSHHQVQVYRRFVQRRMVHGARRKKKQLIITRWKYFLAQRKGQRHSIEVVIKAKKVLSIKIVFRSWKCLAGRRKLLQRRLKARTSNTERNRSTICFLLWRTMVSECRLRKQRHLRGLVRRKINREQSKALIKWRTVVVFSLRQHEALKMIGCRSARRQLRMNFTKYQRNIAEKRLQQQSASVLAQKVYQRSVSSAFFKFNRYRVSHVRMISGLRTILQTWHRTLGHRKKQAFVQLRLNQIGEGTSIAISQLELAHLTMKSNAIETSNRQYRCFLWWRHWTVDVIARNKWLLAMDQSSSLRKNFNAWRRTCRVDKRLGGILLRSIHRKTTTIQRDVWRKWMLTPKIVVVDDQRIDRTPISPRIHKAFYAWTVLTVNEQKRKQTSEWIITRRFHRNQTIKLQKILDQWKKKTIVRMERKLILMKIPLSLQRRQRRKAWYHWCTISHTIQHSIYLRELETQVVRSKIAQLKSHLAMRQRQCRALVFSRWRNHALRKRRRLIVLTRIAVRLEERFLLAAMKVWAETSQRICARSLLLKQILIRRIDRTKFELSHHFMRWRHRSMHLKLILNALTRSQERNLRRRVLNQWRGRVATRFKRMRAGLSLLSMLARKRDRRQVLCAWWVWKKAHLTLQAAAANI